MRTPGKDLVLTSDHLNFSYSDEGPEHAPAIIFIHGFPFNQKMWQAQAELLKNNYRVITYDVRGHGSSSAGEEHFSITLFADDLISIMDLMQISKAAVCGLSMGGYIALNAM